MDILEKELWKTNYVQPLFDKYISVPTKLKYMVIEKDYIKMGGKKWAEDQMRYMYDDSETFIFAFDSAMGSLGKISRKNILNKYWKGLAWEEYCKIVSSGAYYKYVSGKWSADKEYFIGIIEQQEKDKEYVSTILN